MVSKVTEARSIFAQLPSELRKRFHNDPAELVVFMSDSANVEEAISLGLMSKPVVLPLEPQHHASRLRRALQYQDAS